MSKIHRRALLGAPAAAALAAALPARAQMSRSSSFDYEVQRSEAEWRAMLNTEEFDILRRGGTEQPHTHPHSSETVEGIYTCKGCDLPLYSSRWKVILDKGWLFFRHSEEDAVLTSIDKGVYSQLGDSSMGPVVPEEAVADLTEEEVRAFDSLLLIEVHCRRCASHMGHLLIADRKLLHCINGTAMNFTAA